MKTADPGNLKLFCSRCSRWSWAARPGLPEGWARSTEEGLPVCPSCHVSDETDDVRGLPVEEEMPEVVTLCGSTRFKDAFVSENRRLSLDGKIVISLGVFCHQEPDFDWESLEGSLDQLHFRKIDLANRVHVINIEGYIGESTSREIAYAESKGKRISYMEEQPLSMPACPSSRVIDEIDDGQELPMASWNKALTEEELKQFNEGNILHKCPDCGECHGPGFKCLRHDVAKHQAQEQEIVQAYFTCEVCHRRDSVQARGATSAAYIPKGWHNRTLCMECYRVDTFPKCPDCGECHGPGFKCLRHVAAEHQARQEDPDVEAIKSDRYMVREYVLDEAKRLVCGDRNASYGDPRQDFTRTAGLMTAMMAHKLKDGEVVDAVDVARLLICVKLSRSVHQKKLDNAVDGAGYFACLGHCEFDPEDIPK